MRRKCALAIGSNVDPSVVEARWRVEVAWEAFSVQLPVLLEMLSGKTAAAFGPAICEDLQRCSVKISTANYLFQIIESLQLAMCCRQDQRGKVMNHFVAFGVAHQAMC